MDFLYLIFYGCLRLRFLDVETNPGDVETNPDDNLIIVLYLMTAEYSVVICWAWPGTLVT